MNGIVEWFARNSVAANLVAAFIVVSGLVAIPSIKQEVFPEFDSDHVIIEVPFPGSTPSEVEEMICARVEQAVQGLSGVKTVHSTSAENIGLIYIELLPQIDSEAFLDKVKARVDAIETFPEEAKKPVISNFIIRKQVINVAVYGDVGELPLKRAGERVRDELLALPEISQVELINVRPYEVSVELREEDLRLYGLTFDEVALAIRHSSLNLPGGSIKTQGGEILLRSNTQAYSENDFRMLPLRAKNDGSQLRLGEVARITNGFAEVDSSSIFDGKPAALVRVFRVGKQSAIGISSAAKSYVHHAQSSMPAGVFLETWQDDSSYLRGRLDLLYRNGKMGLALVFLILALFLRFRLAIWVTFGIPVSFLGTLWLMPQMDISISLISLFGFIVVLGIVVDDAIVMGENIYTHQQKNGPGIKNTIIGAKEVARPVVFGVLTTIAAFYPLIAIEGNIGKVLRYIPLIVIPTLFFSLIECIVILPAHLKNLPQSEATEKLRGWARFQKWFSSGVEQFALRVYQPILGFCLRFRYAALCLGISTLLLVLAGYAGGHFRFTFFPPVEGDNVAAWVTFPRGVPVEKTEEAVKRLLDSAGQLQKGIGMDSGNTNVILHSLASVGQQPFRRDAEQAGGNYGSSHMGSHNGEVHLEVSPSEERNISSQEMARRWREIAGEFPGAIEVGFSANIFSAGKPVNIRLTGPNMSILQAASTELKSKLRLIDGVEDISDSFRVGKQEIDLKLNSQGQALGLSQNDLAKQVRQAFFGEEAQRIQRNRDDVKVMVRYPKESRQSVRDLYDLRIRTSGGEEIPVKQVADIEAGVGYASISRVDGRRSVNITADVDPQKAQASQVIERLRSEELPDLLSKHPGIQYGFDGDRQEQEVALSSMLRSYLIAMVIIYALLAIPFGSYLQPFIVMCAIPFGLIGAVAGHLIMGMDLTILSMFGVVALTGVVVNDSLIMVDYVNRNRNKYENLMEAVRMSGVARFRAILLTSLTTFAGLAPLIFFEKSVQAQFLIPMAISLAFGVIFATAVTLVLVPAGYIILEDVKASWYWLYGSQTAAQPDEVTRQGVQIRNI